MIRNHQLIWLPVLQRWQLVKLGGKTTSSSKQPQHKIISMCCRLRLAALGVLMASGAALASDLPTGGAVSLGQGHIIYPDDQQSHNKQLHIQQQSGKLAIDWQQFNIGADNKVLFQQPNTKAVALNRVIGSEGTKIMGQLQSNGQVFIINPNGVLFGKNAKVNVGGLIASTLELTNRQLSAEQYHFSSDQQSPGLVINQGEITSSNKGHVVLLGGEVNNQGTITSNQGSIALAAGKSAILALSSDGLIQLEVSEAALNARVANGNKLQANGGEVLLATRAQAGVLQEVVNNQGIIEASNLQQRQGKIVLSGGEHGQVIIGGTLRATGENQGGTIITQGAQLTVADTAVVDTRVSEGSSGWWQIKSDSVTITEHGGLSGATLSQQLGSTNIALDSGRQDLTVADPINWSSDHTLRLSSESDLQLQANISATGKHSQLELNHGKQGDYLLSNDSKVTLSGDEAGFTLNGQQYQVIHNVEQLQAINNDLTGHYVLGNTIDASSTKEWREGYGFMPIGFAGSENGDDSIFHGVFSGLGNTIDQLTMIRMTESQTEDVDSSNRHGYGLFSNSQGHLRNVGLSDLEFWVIGRWTDQWVTAGGLVGINSGIVEHVYGTGTIDVDADRNAVTGGLIGNNSGTVRYSFADISVAGESTTGGLIGKNSGTVNHSSTKGAVSGDRYVGGLIGYNTKGTVSDSSAGGSVSGSRHVGGLIGHNDESIVNRVIATGDVTATDSNVGGLIGFTYEGEVNDSSASGMVTTKSYSAGGLIGYAYMSKVNNSSAIGNVTAEISNIGGLIGNNRGSAVNNSVSSGIVSGNDRVGGLIGDNSRGIIKDSIASGAVSGNNKIGGLIGYNSGTVNGSTASGNVTGEKNIGGLVGDNSGVVRNSAAEGAVAGEWYVGGLIGYNTNTVSDSKASGVVSGNETIGGLIGYNLGTVNASAAIGDITAIGSFIGGLVGDNWGAVSNSTATGNVTTTGSYVGGLIGGNVGVVNESSASGGVSGDENVGGLLGDNWGTVTSSSASGNVIATGVAGSLVGLNDYFGEIKNSTATGLVNDEDGPLVGENKGIIEP